MPILRTVLFHAYAIITALLGILLVPLFALHPRGRVRLRERLGLLPVPAGDYCWFHGASMGEVMALLPVLRLARQHFPHLKILLTATSPTGLEAATGCADELRLLPFDSPYFLRRFLGNARPRFLAVSETELWPGLLFECRRRGVALAMVNAIITDYTFGRYRRFAVLSKEMLRTFKVILCGTARSRERLVALGADPGCCEVTGNSKYDRAPSVSGHAEAVTLRQEFFARNVPTLVLGSLRPGEEQIWFPALARAEESRLEYQVVVAPRHKEKFEFFCDQLARYSLRFERRSKQQAPATAPVLLLDTYGELESAYSFCDAAFVGGSLVDWGGHNPLEPACYGVCVAMGPWARNVREIAEEMTEGGALWSIQDAEDAYALVKAVAERAPLLTERGQAARAIWQRHRGTADKIVNRLSELAA